VSRHVTGITPDHLIEIQRSQDVAISRHRRLRVLCDGSKLSFYPAARNIPTSVEILHHRDNNESQRSPHIPAHPTRPSCIKSMTCAGDLGKASTSRETSLKSSDRARPLLKSPQGPHRLQITKRKSLTDRDPVERRDPTPSKPRICRGIWVRFE
jgi:hypothetical protein